MEQGAYKGDVLQKIAGLSFIVGTIVLGVFGLLHPAGDKVHRMDVNFNEFRF